MKLRDVWKVYNLRSLGEMNEGERKKFAEILQNWYTNKVHPECMCKETRPYPKLHVKKSTAGNLFLANNPKSNRGERAHDFQCPFNLSDEGYKGYLKQRGIIINEEGDIICSLKKKKPEGTTENGKGVPCNNQGTRAAPAAPASGENALRYLFLTWLQEALIHEYRPGRPRNLRSRLFRIMAKTKIDSIKLGSDNLFITNSDFRYNFSKHRVVVAWGDKRNYPATISPTHPFVMNLPVFSLDDRQTRLQDITILKSVYDAATLTRRDVDTGYWVLYRSENEGRKLAETELIFEPAEPATGIPIESSYEGTMVRYLVEHNEHFKKPLVGNVTELFLDQRPDMVLLDTDPKTIIEVAGFQDEEYRTNLGKKRDAYEQKGYRYIEWDVTTPIETVILPQKPHESSK